MTSLPSLNATFSLERSISIVREQVSDLHRQLATGQKAVTYGGLGNERTLDISFRGEIAQMDAFASTITHVQVRLDATTQVLNRSREVAAVTKSDALGNVFDPQNTNKTSFQEASRARFSEMVAIMNTKVGNRYVFSGRQTDLPPVIPPEQILDGASGKAGFTQIANERRQADLGADGRGRLTLPVPGGAVVTLSEDHATSPFGFKIGNVGSTLTGTTVPAPSGSPTSLSVTFSGTPPLDGETITIQLELPDGTTKDLTLVARTNTPTEPNEFQIGGSANATATNFQAVLDDMIEETAEIDLRAASLYAAASNFFDFDSTTPPQRVSGPPFNTATALVDGTSSNTIFWYQGEVSSTSARDSAVAQIDDTIALGHGARANEQAFRIIFKQLAAIVTDTYPESDPNSRARYEAVKQRANTSLSFSGNVQSVDNITSEFTVIQATMESARTRHEANADLLKGFTDEIETADIYQVSAQILSLQTRLQATLQVTASLGRLSLVNFIN